MGHFLRTVIATGFCLFLVGCGVGGARRSSTSTATTTTNLANFAVSSFSPESGDVSSVPSTIVITFNQNYLAANVTTLSYYNLSCAGNVFEATSAHYTYGSNYVTVELPPVGGLSAGTPCYFSLSPNVTNETGYTTVGSRSAAYYLTSNVSLKASIASASAASAAVGGRGGTSFAETGGAQDLLSGLNLAAGNYVEAVQGAWQENFRSGGQLLTRNVHGNGDPLTPLRCPAGMRITGLRGRAGLQVEALGIVCKDNAQASYWVSSLIGGTGGGAFAVNCPRGTFARGLSGRSGASLDQLGLVCQ